MLAAALLLFPFAPTLHVEGPKLFYGKKEVMLKGVCVGDVVLARDSQRVGDYKTLSQDWKCNTVRIGMAPSSWKHDRDAAWKALKIDITAALANNMFVIIDWHTIGWPDGYFQDAGGSEDDGDLYDSSTELSNSFWARAASEYKDDGRVVFQLWCEPVSSEEPWKNKPGSTWKTLKPTFETLTKLIRSKGAKNVLLATGDQWAYDLVGIKNSLLPDKNTAYMWHVYAGHDDNDVKRWAKMLDGLQMVRPVMVTEWGFQEGVKDHFKGDANDFGKPFLKFMDQNKLHWTAWCWHPTWGPTMLKDDWKTPTPFGAFVKQALLTSSKTAVRPR